MRVLLIDDSRVQRMVIQRALGQAGHSVIAAEDGEKGLCAARENSPEAVVLDMMLPKLSGLDVLRALRRDSSTARAIIIVLTGLSQKNRAKLLDEGADAFVEKSEALFAGQCEELIASIERHASSRRTPSAARP